MRAEWNLLNKPQVGWIHTVRAAPPWLGHDSLVERGEVRGDPASAGGLAGEPRCLQAARLKRRKAGLSLRPSQTAQRGRFWLPQAG